MDGFLPELGKKLAERWLSLLVLPGLLYLGALALARALGHRHATDVERIVRELTVWASNTNAFAPSALVPMLVAVLLASAGVGLAAQALGSLIERIWLAERWRSWVWPLRQLASACAANRRRRWDKARAAHDEEAEAEGKRRAGNRPGSAADVHPTQGAMTRIAQEEPTRPTWMGDRIAAVVVRLDRDYELDLATIWPHLWISMPDTPRSEITAAREKLTRAATLAGWGVLYCIVGMLCWPGALIAAAVVGVGWRRAREATDVYALLVEAAVRLHTADLARSVGLVHSGPLDKRAGFELTCLLQGQGHLIPLTTDLNTSRQPPSVS